MSESLSRPPVLRHRSQVPGSFNTEDELSPTKASFEGDDDTRQDKLDPASSPGAPFYSDDSSLPLPEHDDMSGGYFGGQTVDNVDGDGRHAVEGDSGFSMIASSAVSTVTSGGDAHAPQASSSSERHMASHASEHESQPVETQKKQARDLVAATTVPSSRVLPTTPNNLAYAFSPHSSQLSAQPSTLETRPLDIRTPTQAHSSAHSQTTTSHMHHQESASGDQPSQSPATSPSRYQTPAPVRTFSRVASLTSLGGYETAEEEGLSPSQRFSRITAEENPSTPKDNHPYHESSSQPITPTPTKANPQDPSENPPNQITNGEPSAKKSKMLSPRSELERILKEFNVPDVPSPVPADYWPLSSDEEELQVFGLSDNPPVVDSDSDFIGYTPEKADKPLVPESSTSAAVAQRKSSEGKRPEPKHTGDALVSTRLSLKDQNFAIDRLQKDNWDLKLRITYLQRMVDQMDDEELKNIVKQNTELQTEKIQSTKTTRELKRSVRELEMKLKSSETETNRLRLEHKTTIRNDKVRITELEQELVETQSEVTQLRRHQLRKTSEARSRSNSAKEALIKQLTQSNAELLREVRAQTSMLTSRNREREQLTQRLEDLKLGLQSHRRTNSNGSNASKSEREHWEDRIGSLKDELSVTKLAELSTAKALQTKRKECDELHSIANHLDKVLVKKGEDIKSLNDTIKALEKEAEQLRNEVRMLDNGIAHIEADCQAKIRRIEELESENEDISHELESIEKALVDANGKNQKLSVELESRQSECAFLREEQDGTMLKIGTLEASLKTTETSLSSEKQRATETEGRLASLEKSLCKAINLSDADQAKIIETITSMHGELIATTEKHTNLGEKLHQRSAIAKATIEKLESELETEQANTKKAATRNKELQEAINSTTQNSDKLSKDLADLEQLLKQRSALLETHGLETRRLTDLVEKERQGRRQDKTQYEQWQRSHQHATRTVAQNTTRINELEAARSADRKKLATIEQTFKDALSERNGLLLTMWHRLSTLCGIDWQHRNALINGHLPTLEVVNNMFQPFSKVLGFAVKCIENTISGFVGKIRSTDLRIQRDFEAYEREIAMHKRHIERLEALIAANQTAAAIRPPIAPLARTSSTSNRAQLAATFARHHSTTDIEVFERAQNKTTEPAPSAPIEPAEQRWNHRLKDLERRLKAEREARLLDRSGARQRLEEGRAETEKLRLELKREKLRSGRE